MSDFLTREKILGLDDLDFEDVDCPLWGGKVRIYALTAAERDDFEIKSQEASTDKTKENLSNLRARLVIAAAHDPVTRQRLFKDEDAEALGAKHGAMVDKLFWVARRLSAFTDGDLEALIKNSAARQTAADSGASA